MVVPFALHRVALTTRWILLQRDIAMTTNDSKEQAEFEYMNLLLRFKNVVDDFSRIDARRMFSPKHRRLLEAILDAHHNGVLLTRKSYLYYLEQTKLSKQHQIAEEMLFNKAHMLNAKSDDAPRLLDEIRKKTVDASVITALQKYKNNRDLDTLTDSLVHLRDNVSDNTGVQYNVMNDIHAKPVSWLWDNRLVLGAINIICGDPNIGKSLVTMDIAARVTTGKGSPLGNGFTKPGSVILLAAEDDDARTIKPRLMAAGADTSKVINIHSVRRSNDDGLGVFDLNTDIRRLDSIVERHQDTQLLIIDPIDSYMGNVDSHKNAEVRGILKKLAVWADRHEIAIIIVKHLTKENKNTKAMYRLSGSIAYVGAARTAWLVSKDHNDGERRIVAQIKNNLAPEQMGLAYHVEGCEIEQLGTARIAWEPNEIDLTADELLEGKEPTRQDEAKRWLQSVLEGEEEVESSKLREMAQSAGIKWRTLQRVKEVLKVETFRNQNPGPWYWKLPASQTPVLQAQETSAGFDELFGS